MTSWQQYPPDAAEDHLPRGTVPYVGPEGAGVMILDMDLTEEMRARIAAGGRLLDPVEFD